MMKRLAVIALSAAALFTISIEAADAADKCNPHNMLLCMQACADRLGTCKHQCPDFMPECHSPGPRCEAAMDRARACATTCETAANACNADCTKGCGKMDDAGPP